MPLLPIKNLNLVILSDYWFLGLCYNSCLGSFPFESFDFCFSSETDFIFSQAFSILYINFFCPISDFILPLTFMSKILCFSPESLKSYDFFILDFALFSRFWIISSYSLFSFSDYLLYEFFCRTVKWFSRLSSKDFSYFVSERDLPKAG